MIMRLRVVQFLAVVLTALALVPGGGHLFALLNKINLGAEQYFIVQNIYRGWALFGVVLIGTLLADLALALVLRRRGGAPFVLALLGFCGVALTLVVFSSGPIPPIRRPQTGPPFPTIGSNCAGSGNIRTPSTRP
jgi:hypothetical protein